jgi:hypothetical protein
MKTKILPVIFVFIGFSCFAQGPILTMQNSGPEPGDILSSIYADTTGVVIGSAGENQVWDYSHLVVGTITLNEVYGSASQGYIKDATVTLGSSLRTYFKVNDSVYSVLAVFYQPVDYMAPLSELIYSQPQVLFTYPFIFSNSFTVPVEGIYYLTGFIDYYRKGTSTSTADGYGTLRVPSGTFKNVLRLKIIQDFRDSVLSNNPPGYSIALTHNEMAFWYDGFHKTPILQIQQSSYTWDDTTSYTKSVLVGEGVNGINDRMESNVTFGLYPDPACDKITIETSPTLHPRQLSIMNLNGQELITRQISEPKAVIDINSLPSGVYFVQLTSDKTVEVGKFVKE